MNDGRMVGGWVWTMKEGRTEKVRGAGVLGRGGGEVSGGMNARLARLECKRLSDIAILHVCMLKREQKEGPRGGRAGG